MATKQETNKEEKEMSEYKYARTNSKGEVILRRDTEETLSFVTSILDKNNILLLNLYYLTPHNFYLALYNLP